MIKQRTQFDCGIATLANALSVGYDHALELYGHDKQRSGVTIQHTASILFNLSFAPVYTAFPGFTKASGIDMTTATPETLEHLGHPQSSKSSPPQAYSIRSFLTAKTSTTQAPPSPALEALASTSVLMQ